MGDKDFFAKGENGKYTNERLVEPDRNDYLNEEAYEKALHDAYVRRLASREELVIPNNANGLSNLAVPSENPAFKALVGDGGSAHDFRNYASYFVLRIKLFEKSTGRAIEAHYTIHEGNTSNELGNEVEGGNLQDFVVARNIDYTYNVTVAGYNNIYHNVQTGNVDEHSWGQGGKIWDIDYISKNPEQSSYDINSGSFYNVIDEEGGIFENAITIQPGYPDIAFRIYGFTDPAKWDEEYKQEHKEISDKESTIHGFNYNFDESVFDNLKGLWPPSKMEYSHYIVGLDKLSDDSSNSSKLLRNLTVIPPDLRAGLRFVNAEESEYAAKSTLEQKKEYFLSKGMDIVDFITQFYALVDEEKNEYKIKEQNKAISFHIFINKTNITNKKYLDRNRYLRAFYIADRNGELDVDGCTQLIKIATAVQYPDKISGQSFEMKGALDSNGQKVLHEGGIVRVNNGLTNEEYNNLVNEGEGIILSETPDLAFRLLGYDGNDFYDYCYNFQLEDYPEFASYWPQNSNATFISKDKLSSTVINESLLNGLKINSPYYNDLDIKTLILNNDYKSRIISEFIASSYNKKAIGDQRAYMRALYVFDKNAFNTDYLKSDKEFVTYQIYGIEQYPEEIPSIQLGWNTTLPYYEIKKYNVIQPFETFEIKIPTLNYTDEENGITLEEGDYNFVLKIGNRDFSSYGVLSSDGEYMVYHIPQSDLKHYGGDVSVQAISRSPKFQNSALEYLGTITLKSPDEAITSDWNKILTEIVKSSTTVTSADLASKVKPTYILFPGTGSFQRVSTSTNDGMKLANNNSLIGVKIYEPCKIIFVANGNGSTTNGINLYFDTYVNVDTYHERKFPIANATSSTTSYSFEITEEDFKDTTEITILLGRATGSGTNIKSFSISE